MQVHADFGGFAFDDVASKLLEHRADGHFVVSQPGWFEATAFTKLLEASQELRVSSGDLPWSRPEVVALGIDRDQEGDARQINYTKAFGRAGIQGSLCGSYCRKPFGTALISSLAVKE